MKKKYTCNDHLLQHIIIIFLLFFIYKSVFSQQLTCRRLRKLAYCSVLLAGTRKGTWWRLFWPYTFGRKNGACPTCASLLLLPKEKQQKLTQTKTPGGGGQFSGMHLREGNSICTDPPQPPFIYHIRAQVCWTSSNSLVFEVQIFEIRATCVHLVYFALLITVIFKKCFLYARSLTVYFSPPLPCPFLPQPLVSLVPVVYCSLMCCNCWWDSWSIC